MKNPGVSSDNLAMSKTSLGSGLNVERGYRSKGGSKKTLVIAAVLIILLLVAVIVLAVLYAKERSDSDSNSESNADKVKATTGPTTSTTPSQRTNCSSTTGFPPPGPPKNQGPYRQAAVAADDVRCSKIGVDILKRNGSAVDAAIASLFCIGVINMHSAGIGGGAVMVVYNKENKTSEYFNFREKAPGNVSQDMFVNKSSESKTGGIQVIKYHWMRLSRPQSQTFIKIIQKFMRVTAELKKYAGALWTYDKYDIYL